MSMSEKGKVYYTVLNNVVLGTCTFLLNNGVDKIN